MRLDCHGSARVVSYHLEPPRMPIYKLRRTITGSIMVVAVVVRMHQQLVYHQTSPPRSGAIARISVHIFVFLGLLHTAFVCDFVDALDLPPRKVVQHHLHCTAVRKRVRCCGVPPIWYLAMSSVDTRRNIWTSGFTYTPLMYSPSDL